MQFPIVVTYTSIDFVHKTNKYWSLKGARAFAVKMVGENAEFGSTYAVSNDGVGKVTVQGCSLAELFGRDA